MATDKKPELTKTAAAATPAAKSTPAETKPAEPRPPSSDPELGKTFKKVESGSAAPAKPAPRPGPGRPRKIPATGDAARVAERPKNSTDRPGNPPATFQPVAPKPAPIALEPKGDLSNAAARTLIQTAAYLVGGVESLLCKINLVDGLAIWKLSKLELDLVEGPGTRVMNKHLPAGAKAYADEIELASILAPIFLNRMYMLLAAKNPQMLAQILAAATGQGSRSEEKQETPPRPQAVPDKKAREPRTTPESPTMEHDAAGDAAAAGMDPSSFAFLSSDGPEWHGAPS